MTTRHLTLTPLADRFAAAASTGASSARPSSTQLSDCSRISRLGS